MQESFTPPTDEEIHAKLSQIEEKNECAKKTSNPEESAKLLKEAFAETIALREQMISPLERKLNLKEQYEEQLQILENTGILQTLSTGEKGIIDINGNEAPVPTYQEVRKRVKENKEVLETKFEQSFTELLLTPFGMSLDLLHEKLGEALVRHYREGKLFAPKLHESDPDEKLELDKSHSIWVWDEYVNADKNGTLVYEPKNFTEKHQGKTKQEIIMAGGTWQISFLENLSNLPGENDGKTIYGRKQLESGKNASDYLELLQTKPMYANEHGITPEDWVAYFLTHLEKTNQVIDDWSGNGRDSWNLEAFFPDSATVPSSYWTRGLHRAGVSTDDTEETSNGARSRVRI